MRNVASIRTDNCLWKWKHQTKIYIYIHVVFYQIRIGFVSRVQPTEAILFSLYLCSFRKNPWFAHSCPFLLVSLCCQESFVKVCRKKVQQISEDDLFVDGEYMSEQDMLDENYKE